MFNKLCRTDQDPVKIPMKNTILVHIISLFDKERDFGVFL